MPTNRNVFRLGLLVFLFSFTVAFANLGNDPDFDLPTRYISVRYNFTDTTDKIVYLSVANNTPSSMRILGGVLC